MRKADGGDLSTCWSWAGRPFFNRQYLNIWFFAFDQVELPPTLSPRGELWYILNFDPSALRQHWMANLRSVGATTVHTVLIWPLGLLALLGLVWSLLHASDRRCRFLVLWTGLYVLAVTLTANKERFFLPVLPALVVLSALFLLRVRDRLAAAGKRCRFSTPPSRLVSGVGCSCTSRGGERAGSLWFAEPTLSPRKPGARDQMG